MDEINAEINDMRNKIIELEGEIKQKKKILKEMKSPICGRVKMDMKKDTNNYLLYIRDSNIGHWKWMDAIPCRDDMIKCIDELIHDLQGIKEKI